MKRVKEHLPELAGSWAGRDRGKLGMEGEGKHLPTN